jgi:hypothetical protein
MPHAATASTQVRYSSLFDTHATIQHYIMKYCSIIKKTEKKKLLFCVEHLSVTYLIELFSSYHRHPNTENVI